MRFKLNVIAIIVGLAVLASCGSKSGNESTSLKGEIKIDGSSTVYPITEAVAEEFRTVQPAVNVSVGVSGTGGGFKRFGRGEIDLNNASRPIKENESKTCQENSITFVDLMVAYDGLAVLVNPQNTWVDHLTVEELKKIWEPEAQGKITMWSQIREGWPNEPFHLFGPGVASGTYDYFTEAIVGKSGSSRGDYTASEDDNVLVQGISGDKNALGFFGHAYYEENKEKLKLVGVNNGKGVVLPSAETVKDGSYAPLSRPVFIYVTKSAAQRPEVSAFVDFYLKNATTLVPDVGYIPLTAEGYTKEQAKFSAFVAGN